MTIKNNNNVQTLALFMPEIKSSLAAKKFIQLRDILSKIPPIDLAEGWDDFIPQEKILIFKLLSVEFVTEFFESLKSEEQEFLFNNLDDSNVAQILNEMAPDERADLFKDLPEDVYQKFLSLMKQKEAADVRKLLTYEEGTAGAVMTTDFVELVKEMKAKSAILKLHESLSFDHDLDIASIYVTDETHKLLGVVELQALIKAPPDMPIEDIMESAEHIKVNEFMPEEKVAHVFKHYDLNIAPVVSEDDKLIGVITVDDIVDVIEKEATEDFEKIAAVLPVDKPYMEANFFNLVWKRSFWLIVLVVVESMSAFVLKFNNQTIHNMLALTFFVPILIAMGGNAGTQSATIIIRSLALGDVGVRDFFRVVFRESLLGVCMGITVAVVGSIIVTLMEDRKSTRLNSSHIPLSRMPSSA